MTSREARGEADRMNREHPDRASYRWIARPTGDHWDIVRVRIPGLGRLPVRESIEAAEKPPQPDDPRPTYVRNAPGSFG
jgi:hypothetical protein